MCKTEQVRDIISQIWLPFVKEKITAHDNKAGLVIKIQFNRQISNILLVTYLPTTLMNIINQATNYFIGEEFFGDAIAVNITCMMVLSSIYVAVSGSLPSRADVKYVDIWLLFSLIYPFLVVLINTYIHVEKIRSCAPVVPCSKLAKSV